jgi:hypothetical protein
MGWISRLFGGGPPPAGPATGARVGAQQPTEPVSVAPAPAPAAAPALAATPTAAPGPPLLCWLLDAAPPQPGLLPIERQALDAVDQVLAQPALPADLLPRAANVVPQLLALLRQQDLPVPVLADRIGRDPVLAAEVLRQAGGAYFAHLGPVNDLPQAIQRLGIEGLQMAIARVVLRPLYQARPGTLPAQTAPRLWEHAERCRVMPANRPAPPASRLSTATWPACCTIPAGRCSSTRCSAAASPAWAPSASTAWPPWTPAPTCCSAAPPRAGRSRRPSRPLPPMPSVSAGAQPGSAGAGAAGGPGPLHGRTGARLRAAPGPGTGQKWRVTASTMR